MWFKIAAIVELFPDPVIPVTRIIPRSAAAMVVRTDGSLSDSNVGMSNGITRITIMKDERCRRILTRKRPTPGTPHEQSYSCSLSRRPRSSSFGDRKSTRLNSSHSQISYAVFCLHKKKHSEQTTVTCTDC